MSDAHAQSARELLQHARTLQAMGVDWLPVALREPAAGVSIVSPASPVTPASTVTPVAPAAHVDAAPPVAAASVRAADRPSPRPTPRPSVSPASPPPAAAVVEAKPADGGESDAATGGVAPLIRHPLLDTDPARIEAQRRLDELRERYERDAPHQHFVTDHHSIVWGEGDPKARLMFVGEAPGAEEDKVGRPFVGRAGQLLDKMIVALGLKRHEVYIANVLKTRPPNNATPTFEEAAACAPYLFEQIAIIDPTCIVALGLPASRTLLNTSASMASLRGNWWTYQPPEELVAKGARAIEVMPTYHPAFLLRSYTKENRAKVWADLQKAGERVGSSAK